MLHRFLKAGLLTLPLMISGCPDDTPPITTGDGSSSTTDGPLTSTTLPTMTTDATVGTSNMTSGSSSADSTVGPPVTTGDTTGDTTVGPGDTTTSGPGTSSGGMSSSGSSGPGTTGGDDGNCCTPHPATGCEVPAIETCVCGLDPFCCSMEWDQICVDEAINDCAANCPGAGTGGSTGMAGTGTGGGGGGDCCSDNGTPGCDDPACEAAVCAVDPFCCSMQWDNICADGAQVECPMLCSPGGTGTGGTGMGTGGTGGVTTGATTTGAGTGGTAGMGGDCCVANGSPGCDDPVCEGDVCAADPFCCDTEWDGICADGAGILCPALCPGGGGSGTTGGGGGTGGVGDCCAANGTPGCDDPVCEAAVCAVDPFCCSMQWDNICADEALMECPALCP